MAKKRMNYFENNIQKFGEDFLDFKKAEEIQRDCKIIFKDMVFGNIDYEKHGMYFMEPRFLEQLIIQSEIEAKNHDLKYRALHEFSLNHDDVYATQLSSIESNMAWIMGTIYKQLLLVKYNNYDISFLTYLPSLLRDYRNTMKKY